MKVTLELDSFFAGQVRAAIRDLDYHYTSLDELARLIEDAEREAIVARATRNSLVSPPLPRLDEPPIQTGEQVHGPRPTQG